MEFDRAVGDQKSVTAVRLYGFITLCNGQSLENKSRHFNKWMSGNLCSIVLYIYYICILLFLLSCQFSFATRGAPVSFTREVWQVQIFLLSKMAKAAFFQT